MKTIYLFLTVLIYTHFVQLQGFAQSDADVNLQKYWYYRWRLTNDFIKVGEGKGHSIPIQSRQGYAGIPDIEVADATIYQGFYLAILATEYKLLQINRRFVDMERTKTELYYAIKAFERLDAYGEEYYGLPPKIDGHFQRDDIPCDFLDPQINPENFKHFNQGLHQPKGIEPVWKVFTSDDCPNGQTLQDKSNPRVAASMSQDQVIWLLMGFSMIEKCVDAKDKVTLLNGSKVDFDFNFEARRHATNMINYIKYKYPDKPGKERWRLFRPDGVKIFPGQNAYMFKYPLSVIGERMHHEEAENNQKFDRKRGRTQWKLTRVWIPYKNVNGQMITVLGAISGKWAKTEERTMQAIQKIWKNRNWEHFYLPLMSVLHDIDLTDYQLDDKIESDLNAAPAVGPYNLTRNEIARFADSLEIPHYPTGWTRHLKYSSSLENQTDGTIDSYMRRGFYSGLDYMLLFNLYYLTTQKPLPLYQNLVHRFVSQNDLPNDENVGQKSMMGAFIKLTMINAKQVEKVVEIRAGEDFEVLENAQRPKRDAAQSLLEIAYFNPWDKSCMLANDYGWSEEFTKVKHLQVRQQKK